MSDDALNGQEDPPTEFASALEIRSRLGEMLQARKINLRETEWFVHAGPQRTSGRSLP